MIEQYFSNSYYNHLTLYAKVVYFEPSSHHETIFNVSPDTSILPKIVAVSLSENLSEKVSFFNQQG